MSIQSRGVAFVMAVLLFLCPGAAWAQGKNVPAELIEQLPEGWQEAEVLDFAQHIPKAIIEAQAILLRGGDSLGLAMYVRKGSRWELAVFNEALGYGDCPIPSIRFAGGNSYGPDHFTLQYTYKGKEAILTFEPDSYNEVPLDRWKFCECRFGEADAEWGTAWQIMYTHIGDQDGYLLGIYFDRREPEHGDVMGYLLLLERMKDRSLEHFSLNDFRLYLDKVDRVTIRPPET